MVDRGTRARSMASCAGTVPIRLLGTLVLIFCADELSAAKLKRDQLHAAILIGNSLVERPNELSVAQKSMFVDGVCAAPGGGARSSAGGGASGSGTAATGSGAGGSGGGTSGGGTSSDAASSGPSGAAESRPPLKCSKGMYQEENGVWGGAPAGSGAEPQRGAGQSPAKKKLRF